MDILEYNINMLGRSLYEPHEINPYYGPKEVILNIIIMLLCSKNFQNYKKIIVVATILGQN